MTDEEIMAAAQQAAVAKMRARHGLSNEQIAKLQQSIAAPTPTNTVTTADLEAAWRRSADGQLKSLGIAPVSDEEAAKMQEKMGAAVAEKQAARAAEMDDQLRKLQAGA
jgi:hypothetical protein